MIMSLIAPLSKRQRHLLILASTNRQSDATTGRSHRRMVNSTSKQDVSSRNGLENLPPDHRYLPDLLLALKRLPSSLASLMILLRLPSSISRPESPMSRSRSQMAFELVRRSFEELDVEVESSGLCISSNVAPRFVRYLGHISSR